MDVERAGVLEPQVFNPVCYRNVHAIYGERAQGSIAFMCCWRILISIELHKPLGTPVSKGR